MLWLVCSMLRSPLFLPLVLLLPPNRVSQSSKPQAGMPIEPIRLPIGWLVLTYAIALIIQAMFYMISVQLPFYGYT